MGFPEHCEIFGIFMVLNCEIFGISVFVAQMLKASGNELYYHTWPTESGKHNYEIDFRKDADVFMVPVFMTMFL